MHKPLVILALLLIPCAMSYADELKSLVLGEWNFKVCFEVAGEGLSVSSPQDAPKQEEAVISFSSDGTGKVTVASEAASFSWEAQPDDSIKYKLGEYESSLYFQKIGAAQLLMVEKQNPRSISIAVLTRVP